MSRRRAIGIAAVCAAAAALLLLLRQAPPAAAPTAAELDAPAWIVDRSGYTEAADLPRFTNYLSLIRDESNIDIRLVFDRLPAGVDIHSAAADLVERLGIGRSTGAQRGLLLYFDVAAQRLKVEVGYGLEAYFPDAYVAFLVDRHAPLFFGAENRSLGLRLLLRLLHARIRDAALGGSFDPSPYGPAAALSLSGGAGSNSDLRDSSRARLPNAQRTSAYAAGPTPSETYASYLRLLSAPEWDPEADLFTVESRQYLKQFPLSRAYRDFILLGEHGKSWKIETRRDLALLFFTGTPFASPHFFIQENGVWRIDLIAETRNTKERVGGPLTWSYEGSNDRYKTAFADLLTVVDGYRRVAAGDNRPLPTQSSRAK